MTQPGGVVRRLSPRPGGGAAILIDIGTLRLARVEPATAGRHRPATTELCVTAVDVPSTAQAPAVENPMTR